jgi:CRP/FNR family transcriptional regulator
MEAEESVKKNTVSYKAGSVIFFEGDFGQEMYIVKSGEVEIIKEIGDGSIVLAKLGENEFFGEMALFGEPKRSSTIRTSADTELIAINKQMLESQFRKVPEWLVAMIKTIAQRILNTEKGIKFKFTVSVEFSILKLLILLLEEYGVTEERGKSINYTIVREEISNTIGISTNDVDEWLKKFNFVNLIRVVASKNTIVITDEERVQKFLTYLLLKSSQKVSIEETLDQNMILSFDRIYKLISRKV